MFQACQQIPPGGSTRRLCHANSCESLMKPKFCSLARQLHGDALRASKSFLRHRVVIMFLPWLTCVLARVPPKLSKPTTRSFDVGLWRLAYQLSPTMLSTLMPATCGWQSKFGQLGLVKWCSARCGSHQVPSKNIASLAGDGLM